MPGSQMSLNSMEEQVKSCSVWWISICENTCFEGVHIWMKPRFHLQFAFIDLQDA